MTPAHERDTLSLGEFEFECGESIPDLELAYETHGEFTGDDAVLVCHALTGSAHVAGRRRRVGAGGDGDESTGTGTHGQARAWWDDKIGRAHV